MEMCVHIAIISPNMLKVCGYILNSVKRLREQAARDMSKIQMAQGYLDAVSTLSPRKPRI